MGWGLLWLLLSWLVVLVSSPSLRFLLSGFFHGSVGSVDRFSYLVPSALKLFLTLLLFWGILWGGSLPLSLGLGLPGLTYKTLWVLLCLICVWEGFLPPRSSRLGFLPSSFFWFS